MKRLRFALFIFIFVLLAFIAGWFYPVLHRPPLVLNQDAVVAGVEPAEVSVLYNLDSGGFIDVTPHEGFDTLLNFYPGGLVRPQAYAWLGVALAPHGIRTLIPVFPFDLGVTAPDRAEKLLALAESKRVVLSGHSLGGAMAARYLARHPDAATGLVLLGAFSAEDDDLSAFPLDVLVLAAENDGLATLGEMRAGLARLPSTARLTVIGGAVHSFFGRYGPQRGDGLPTVTCAAAERQIIGALGAFLQ